MVLPLDDYLKLRREAGAVCVLSDTGDLRAVFPGVREGVLVAALRRHGGDVQRAAEDVLRSQERRQRAAATTPVVTQNENGHHHGKRSISRALPTEEPRRQPRTFSHWTGKPVAPPRAARVVPVPPPENADVGAGSGVNAAAQLRLAEMLPHLELDDITASLALHNGGFSDDDESKAVEFLLSSHGDGVMNGGVR